MANAANTFTISGSDSGQSCSWDHTSPTFSVIVTVTSITSEKNYKIQVQCVKYSTEENYESDDEIFEDDGDYTGGYYNAQFYVYATINGTTQTLVNVPAKTSGKRYSWDITGSEFTISNDSDFTIYAHCAAKNCVDDPDSSAAGSYSHDYAIMYVVNNIYTAPSSLTISKSARTGKTITVSYSFKTGTVTSGKVRVYINNNTSKYAEASYSSSSSGTTKTGTLTITGLSNSTSYTINAYVTDNTSTVYAGATISDNTYGCAVSISSIKTRGCTLSFSVPSNAHSYSGNIHYAIYEGSSASGDPVVSGSTSISNTVTVSKQLDPSTSYYVYVYLTGVTYSSTYDANNHNTFTTLAMFSGLTIGLVSTGKTITATCSWTANGSTGITGKVSNGSSGTQHTLSNGSYTFTGLTQGTSYTIYLWVTDSEDNEASKSASVYTYSITITTGTFSNTATLKLDTKAIMFKAVIATGDSNMSSKTLNYSVSGGNASASASGISGSAGTAITVTNLDHNTTYTITYDVDGMTDATKTATMTTALLSLSNTGVTWKQSTVSSTWQAYATPSGGSAVSYDTTYINQTAIAISSSNCSCVGSAESGYQTPETTPSLTDSTYKALAYALLTYYCAYIVTCAITDGHNIVTANVSGHTTFPYAYVYNGSEWKKAMPYIYNGSSWILAPVYVYNGSAYKVCNGD